MNGVGMTQYQRGLVTLDVGTLEQLGFDLTDCTFGVQINEDGKVWVCINGCTFLRFKPNGKPLEAPGMQMHGETISTEYIEDEGRG